MVSQHRRRRRNIRILALRAHTHTPNTQIYAQLTTKNTEKHTRRLGQCDKTLVKNCTLCTCGILQRTEYSVSIRSFHRWIVCADGFLDFWAHYSHAHRVQVVFGGFTFWLFERSRTLRPTQCTYIWLWQVLYSNQYCIRAAPRKTLSTNN